MILIYPCELVLSFSVDWILFRGAVLVILVAFAEQFRKMTATLVRYTRLSSWNNSASTGQIFTEFDILVFFENLSGENSSFNKEIRSVYTFDHISLSSS